TDAHRETFAVPTEKATIGTMAFVPRFADNVSIPVIAAAGTMREGGVRAAVAVGAEVEHMSSDLLSSTESGKMEQHKDVSLNSTEDRPVVTSAFSGKPARGVENKFIAEMKQHEHDLPGYPIQNTLTKDIRKAAAEQNKPEYMSLWSGQNTRLSRNINAEGII